MTQGSTCPSCAQQKQRGMIHHFQELASVSGSDTVPSRRSNTSIKANSKRE